MTELLEPILANPIYKSASMGIGALCLAICIALLFWLFRDAQRRGAATFLWAGVGFGALLAGMAVGFGIKGWGFGPIGLIPFVVLVLFVIVYLIVRPSEYLDDVQEREMSIRLLEAELDKQVCPSCSGPVEPEYLICPNCTTELRVQCTYCGRPVKRNWRACPYCKSRQTV